MMPLTSVEVQHIASESAKAAVREVLITMGVDVTNPQALIELQRDFSHLRGWRNAVATLRVTSITAALGILVSGIAGGVWLAIKGH